MVSVRLLRFMECRYVLPTTQLAYRINIGTCDDLLCVAHTSQSALKMGQDSRMVKIDFSADFDKVDHQENHFKLCSVGVGSLVISVLTQFLSNRSQYVLVDGCRSKLVNVVSGALFGVSSSSCTPQSFSLYWKTSSMVMLTTPLWLLLWHLMLRE